MRKYGAGPGEARPIYVRSNAGRNRIHNASERHQFRGMKRTRFSKAKQTLGRAACDRGMSRRSRRHAALEISAELDLMTDEIHPYAPKFGAHSWQARLHRWFTAAPRRQGSLRLAAFITWSSSLDEDSDDWRDHESFHDLSPEDWRGCSDQEEEYESWYGYDDGYGYADSYEDSYESRHADEDPTDAAWIAAWMRGEDAPGLYDRDDERLDIYGWGSYDETEDEEREYRESLTDMDDCDWSWQSRELPAGRLGADADRNSERLRAGDRHYQQRRRSVMVAGTYPKAQARTA